MKFLLAIVTHCQRFNDGWPSTQGLQSSLPVSQTAGNASARL